MTADSRTPLRFGPLATRRPGEAVITDAPTTPDGPAARFTPTRSPHGLGCACCTPRSAAALALASLHRTRVTTGAFQTVLAVVTPQGETELRATLATDLLSTARFRLE